jgi:uncharacterized membrane protein SpoIIM required for sporulation
MYFLAGWFPTIPLLVEILVLTVAHAACMVSAAVVISAQTNSVRAANLLASFVIVPAALLMQGESIVMFYRMYGALWWIIAAVFILTMIFLRIGLRQFRREELLSREVEEIRFDRMGSFFWRSLSGGARTPAQWYRQAVGPALGRTLPAVPWTIVGVSFGAIAGIYFANRYPFPAGILQLGNYRQNFLDSLGALGFFTAGGTLQIFYHNVQAIFLGSLLGMISLGIIGLVVIMLPIAIIAYATVILAHGGFAPGLFLLGLVLPHGIVEIPAMILAGAAILRAGNCWLAKPDGRSLGQLWLQALADWFTVLLGVVVPMLLVSAILETWLTPLVASWVMGW